MENFECIQSTASFISLVKFTPKSIEAADEKGA